MYLRRQSAPQTGLRHVVLCPGALNHPSTEPCWKKAVCHSAVLRRKRRRHLEVGPRNILHAGWSAADLREECGSYHEPFGLLIPLQRPSCRMPHLSKTTLSGSGQVAEVTRGSRSCKLLSTLTRRSMPSGSPASKQGWRSVAASNLLE